MAFTTALGYILALQNFQAFSLYPVLGIFLLSCGAAAMNHYQERSTDLLMDRTRNRPLPSGTITPGKVLMISICLLLSGSIVLLLKTNLLTLEIGLFTFAWYNLVYTPLKKLTPWAIIPGSLVGALPPIAGWVAAGGYLLDPKILLIASYFFVWQIPHFWLLLLVYGKDYDKGGFPTLTNIFSKTQLIRITFSWLLLTIAIALSINFFGILNFYASNIFLILASGWIILQSFRFLKTTGDKKEAKNMFIRINIFTLLIITSLSLDKLIELFLT